MNKINVVNKVRSEESVLLNSGFYNMMKDYNLISDSPDALKVAIFNFNDIVDNSPYAISERERIQSQPDNVKIIVDYSVEAIGNDSVGHINGIFETLNKTGFLLTSNSLCKELKPQQNITPLNVEYFEWQIINNDAIQAKKFDKPIKDTKHKSFLYVTGSPKIGRFMMTGALHMENLLKDSYYSFITRDMYTGDDIYPSNIFSFNRSNGIISQFVKSLSEFLKTYIFYTYRLSELEETILGSQSYVPWAGHNEARVLKRYMDITNFSLVVETMWVENSFGVPNDIVFFTEKTYRCLLYGHPFVIFGKQNSIRELRKKGYRTYDRIINHDYDDIDSPIERLQELIAEIKRLINVDWSKHHKYIVEVQEHNKKLVNNRQADFFQNNDLRRLFNE